jgi:hypothetical protein
MVNDEVPNTGQVTLAATVCALDEQMIGQAIKPAAARADQQTAYAARTSMTHSDFVSR